MDCSPPGSSVPGIFPARILKWVAISFSRRSFPPRDWTCPSSAPCIGWQIHRESNVINLTLGDWLFLLGYCSILWLQLNSGNVWISFSERKPFFFFSLCTSSIMVVKVTMFKSSLTKSWSSWISSCWHPWEYQLPNFLLKPLTWWVSEDSYGTQIFLHLSLFTCQLVPYFLCYQSSKYFLFLLLLLLFELMIKHTVESVSQNACFQVQVTLNVFAGWVISVSSCP